MAFFMLFSDLLRRIKFLIDKYFKAGTRGDKKSPTNHWICGTCVFTVRFFRLIQRRDRDSNPGCLAAQRFSRPPQSTTLPPLQNFFFRSAFLLKRCKDTNHFLFYKLFCTKTEQLYQNSCLYPLRNEHNGI